MAAKTFYFKNAVPSGATLHRSLQDGGTAPTAATTSTGWAIGDHSAAARCIQVGGSEISYADALWSASNQPVSAPSQTGGDCWRSENLIVGTFDNADWTITFGMRSVTAAYTGRLKIALRIWKTSDANGSSAIELTAGRITTAASTANLSTSADTTLTATFSPGAAIVLNNEYLYIQVALEVTSIGSGSTMDLDFRVGSTFNCTTANFTAASLNYFPAKGAAVITGGTPTAQRADSIFPAIATLVASGGTPTISVSSGRDVRVSWARLVTPTTTIVNTTCAPGVGSIVATGLAPTLRADVIRVPAIGSIVATGGTPSLLRAYNIATGVGALVATGFAPGANRTDNQTAAPPIGSAVFVGLAPTVAGTGAKIANPPVGALVVAGFAPVANRTANQVPAPPVGSVLVVGNAPTVSVSTAATATPGRGAITITGGTPSAQLSSVRRVVVTWARVITPAFTAGVSISIPVGVGHVAIAGATPVEGHYGVDIFWDDVGADQGYRVKWGTAAGVYAYSMDVAADVLTAFISGLSYGQTYYFSICALVGGVEQMASSETVLTIGFMPTPTIGAIAVSGFAPVAITSAFRPAPPVGHLALVGGLPNLPKTPVSMAAAAGSYAVSGGAVLFVRHRQKLDANPGAAAASGAAEFVHTWVRIAAAGSAVQVGAPAAIRFGHSMVAIAGKYNLTGADSLEIRGLAILADSGAFDWVGGQAVSGVPSATPHRIFTVETRKAPVTARHTADMAPDPGTAPRRRFLVAPRRHRG